MLPFDDALKRNIPLRTASCKEYSTMSKSSKKTTARRSIAKSAAKAARTLITDAFTIKVLKKENPFTGEVQKSNAAKVLSSKTVAEAKKKGADSWTVRELVNRKIIAVTKAA
jgi:hypothetical protein